MHESHRLCLSTAAKIAESKENEQMFIQFQYILATDYERQTKIWCFSDEFGYEILHYEFLIIIHEIGSMVFTA